MIYMRGQAADYDGWAAQGNTGWSWYDVLPVFKHVEDHYAGASAFHRPSGTSRVEPQRLSGPILDAFRQAAAQAGIASIDAFNRGDKAGSSYLGWKKRQDV